METCNCSHFLAPLEQDCCDWEYVSLLGCIALASLGIQNYRVSIGPTRYKLQSGKEDIWTILEGNIFYHLMMMMQGGCGGGEVVELSEVVA